MEDRRMLMMKVSDVLAWVCLILVQFLVAIPVLLLLMDTWDEAIVGALVAVVMSHPLRLLGRWLRRQVASLFGLGPR